MRTGERTRTLEDTVHEQYSKERKKNPLGGYVPLRGHIQTKSRF
jgi:hypothetical protein